MLKSYKHTTSADASATLFTVVAGHAAIVLSMQISGGANGGDITLTHNDSSSDVFSETLTIDAGDVAIIDDKRVFEAGESMKISATAAGMQVRVNLSDDEA